MGSFARNQKYKKKEEKAYYLCVFGEFQLRIELYVIVVCNTIELQLLLFLSFNDWNIDVVISALVQIFVYKLCERQHLISLRALLYFCVGTV